MIDFIPWKIVCMWIIGYITMVATFKFLQHRIDPFLGAPIVVSVGLFFMFLSLRFMGGLT